MFKKLFCTVFICVVMGCGSKTDNSSSSSIISSASSSDGSSTSLSSSSSSSSVIPFNELTIQENQLGFCQTQGVVQTEHNGFTGTGYINADNAVGAGIEWRIRASEVGSIVLI